MRIDLKYLVEATLISVVTLFLIFVAASLLFDIFSFSRNGYLRPTHLPRQFMTNRQPAAPTDLQSWMTFSYLNKVFRLPNEYLKNSLSIGDRRYPRLTIKQFSEINNLSTEQAIFKVQTALSEYAVTPSSTLH